MHCPSLCKITAPMENDGRKEREKSSAQLTPKLLTKKNGNLSSLPVTPDYIFCSGSHSKQTIPVSSGLK